MKCWQAYNIFGGSKKITQCSLWSGIWICAWTGFRNFYRLMAQNLIFFIFLRKANNKFRFFSDYFEIARTDVPKTFQGILQLVSQYIQNITLSKSEV